MNDPCTRVRMYECTRSMAVPSYPRTPIAYSLLACQLARSSAAIPNSAIRIWQSKLSKPEPFLGLWLPSGEYTAEDAAAAGTKATKVLEIAHGFVGDRFAVGRSAR